MRERNEPAIGSTWVEKDRGHWPLDVVTVWATYPDVGGTNVDLTERESFFRGAVAFEIIDGRNGPKGDEVRPARCRRIWSLAAFLRDMEPQQ